MGGQRLDGVIESYEGLCEVMGCYGRAGIMGDSGCLAACQSVLRGNANVEQHLQTFIPAVPSGTHLCLDNI